MVLKFVTRSRNVMENCILASYPTLLLVRSTVVVVPQTAAHACCKLTYGIILCVWCMWCVHV